jgi:hypothetical protein
MAEPAPHGCDHEGPGEIATRKAGHRLTRALAPKLAPDSSTHDRIGRDAPPQGIG